MKTRRRLVGGLCAVASVLAVGLTLRTNQTVASNPSAQVVIDDLGDSSFCDKLRSGVNNRGHIVATSVRNGNRVAMIYANSDRQQNAKLISLSVATRINELGQVAGAVIRDGQTNAAVWDAAFGLTIFPSRAQHSSANGLNEKGQVVGHWVDNQGKYSGFRWSTDHGFEELEQVIGVPVGFGMGINNHGEIVGSAKMDGYYRAFVWSQDKGIIDLGTGMREGSRANAINDQGVVVGHYRIDGEMRAFAWSASQGLIDLNEMLAPSSQWELCTAHDINDHGDILGVGQHEGKNRDFLLRLAIRNGQIQGTPQIQPYDTNPVRTEQPIASVPRI